MEPGVRCVLFWFMWMGIVGVILTPLFFLAGTVRTVLGPIGLVAALYMTRSTWMERRRRRRPE
jgi:hypothetical protein